MFPMKMFDSGIGSKIQNANDKFVIVPTILVAGFAVWLYVKLDVDTTYLKHGLVFWSLWVGVICLVAHTFIYKKDSVSSNQKFQQVNCNQPQQNISMVSSQQPIQ